jgi:phosphoribosylaminoimidazolecarboxamide formyltransferase/IMP cyclohydrolase
MNTETKPPRRALMSVTHKPGIAALAANLQSVGWEIISTGGTAKAISDAGVPVTLVEDVTGFPEMMDGRVKTLHPMVFGGILADRSKVSHMQALVEHHIGLIDLVVVNLYDFAAKPDIEQIDIGGPSLLRAAAKNCASVAVIVDPADYPMIEREIMEGGKVGEDSREYLAIKVFETTASYDAMIATWMRERRDAGHRFMYPVIGAH